MGFSPAVRVWPHGLNVDENGERKGCFIRHNDHRWYEHIEFSIGVG